MVLSPSYNLLSHGSVLTSMCVVGASLLWGSLTEPYKVMGMGGCCVHSGFSASLQGYAGWCALNSRSHVACHVGD